MVNHTFTPMATFAKFRKRIREWKLPSLLLNKYVATLFVFGIWMTFFDQNNFIRQYNRITELNSVQKKTNYYVSETKKAKQQLNAIRYDQKALERFAREEYLMKKPNEDIFVIIEK